MKTTSKISFANLEQLKTIDNKIRSILSRNIYYLPYVLFLLWLFITWIFYSYNIILWK